MSVVYLYVLGRPEGPVKVGITSSLESRVATIRTSCPFPVELLASVGWPSREKARHEERSFHVVHADVRLSGEWFDMDADLASESLETAVELDAHFSQIRANEGLH